MKTLTNDHDLVIRIDENVKNIIAEFQAFKLVISNIEPRLRLVEDSLTKLSPIPSVSHQAVIDDMASLRGRVTTLEDSKVLVLGGWKTLSILLGVASGVMGLLYYLNHIIK